MKVPTLFLCSFSWAIVASISCLALITFVPWRLGFIASGLQEGTNVKGDEGEMQSWKQHWATYLHVIQ